MTTDDIPAVADLEARSFSIPWSAAAFASELTENSIARYLVVERREEEGRTIVAYGGYWKVLDEAHITNMAVSPEARSRGVGRHLLTALLSLAASEGMRRATLEVRVSNAPARRLYESVGFAPVAVRKGYYSDVGEDAVIMWLDDITPFAGGGP